MFDIDKWQEVLTTIWQHKLRTIATAFGVFAGIFMLVLLMGAGQGLRNGVREATVLDATNSIWFIPRRTTMAYKGYKPGRTIKLTEEDLDLVKSSVDGIEYISPENGVQGGRMVTYGNKSGEFEVIAGAEQYFSIKVNLEYTHGRKINYPDNYDARKTCIVGDEITNVLFEKDEDPIGKYIIIDGVAFLVVGVFHDDGQGGRFAERIYIPFNSYQGTFNSSDEINLFAVTTMPGFSGKKVEQAVKKAIYQKHFIHPDDNRAFFIHNQEEQFKEIQGVFTGIEAIILLVSVGSLIAGIMGVSNIMIIVVQERTKEIGVRKAIGATPGSIIGLILQEAMIITITAGILGLALGIAAIEGINSFMVLNGVETDFFKNPNVEMRIALIAMFILVVAGFLAGWIPSRQAARLRPIEALNSENK
ncbi:MAG: ABC transporter permease [Bacteroidia bacterium]|nr:ABC transporter permease [Bacteroidia bacterium]